MDVSERTGDYHRTSIVPMDIAKDCGVLAIACLGTAGVAWYIWLRMTGILVYRNERHR